MPSSVDIGAVSVGRQERAAHNAGEGRIPPESETKDYGHEVNIEPSFSLAAPEWTFSRVESVQTTLSVAPMTISGVAMLPAARN